MIILWDRHRDAKKSSEGPLSPVCLMESLKIKTDANHYWAMKSALMLREVCSVLPFREAFGNAQQSQQNSVEMHDELHFQTLATKVHVQEAVVKRILNQC